MNILKSRFGEVVTLAISLLESVGTNVSKFSPDPLPERGVVPRLSAVPENANDDP
jgi:hypothetical protein